MMRPLRSAKAICCLSIATAYILLSRKASLNIYLVFKTDILVNRLNTYNIFPLSMLTDFDEMRKDDERILTFTGDERKEIKILFEIMLIEKKNSNVFKENVLNSCLNILISMIVNKLSIGIERRDDWYELFKYV